MGNKRCRSERLGRMRPRPISRCIVGTLSPPRYSQASRSFSAPRAGAGSDALRGAEVFNLQTNFASKKVRNCHNHKNPFLFAACFPAVYEGIQIALTKPKEHQARGHAIFRDRGAAGIRARNYGTSSICNGLVDQKSIADVLNVSQQAVSKAVKRMQSGL